MKSQQNQKISNFAILLSLLGGLDWRLANLMPLPPVPSPAILGRTLFPPYVLSLHPQLKI
jgi:hypothetical protein